MLSLGIGNFLVENVKKESSKEALGPMLWLLVSLASNDFHLKTLAELRVAKIAVEYLKGMSSFTGENVLVVTSFLRLLGKWVKMLLSITNKCVKYFGLDYANTMH